MSATNAFFAASVLVAAVSALPALPNNMGPGMASIQQVRRDNYQFIGAVSVYNTYNKFKRPIPDSLARAVQNATGVGKRGNTGSATISPGDSFDGEYLLPVSIGSPPQLVNLEVDTGSSDLWVFSSETPKNQVNGQKIYTPSKSSTAKKQNGSTWSIGYGDGSGASGSVYTDVVSIGGTTVNAQVVESAQQVSSSFSSDSAVSGLLGMAFSSINTVSPKAASTFFDNAKGSLAAPLFTADLKHQAPGTFNFGYINSSLYTGSLTYTPVDTSNGFWQFTSSGYAVGSGSFASASIQGIADTGTSLMYLPDSVVNAYYKQIKGATTKGNYGGWVFPCSSTIPSFSFGVGSARITIPSTYMSYGSVGNNMCFGGLQSSTDIGINIFGDIALKSAFVVFNGGSKPSLGWASKKLN